MVKNKVAGIFLILALMAVLRLPANVESMTGSTIVTINPDPTQADVGLSFDIFVQIENVKGMQAYTGTLTYDTSVLTATSADAEYVGGICEAGCEDITAEGIDDVTGEVTWEVAMPGFPVGFSGSGGMIKITFSVDAVGISALTPVTSLLDIGLVEIPHTDFPGTFDTSPRPTAEFQWDVEQDGTFENGTAITGDSVTFDGSISLNPLGGSLTYSWDVFNDGSEQGNSASLKFTFTNTGGSIVKLTVCATGNVCSPKAKIIQVIEKTAPTAIIWPSSLTIDFKEKAVFNGTASRDNNEPPQNVTRYIFTVNGTVEQNSTSAFFSYTATSPGNYTIGLRACNESNLCSIGISTAQLRVRTVVAAPTAVLTPGDTKIFLGDTLTFNGTQSFDNSNPPLPITRYIFSVNSTVTQNNTSPTFDFTALDIGDYNVSLVSCNQAGSCSNNTAFSIVTVNLAVIPTAVLSPTGSVKIVFGDKILFNATDSFDNNVPPEQIARFIFRVNGTSAQDGSSELYSFNATAPGIYIITLRVCNESGRCSINPANATVTVNPEIHDVAITGASVSSPTVERGANVIITVNATNVGNRGETFQLTVTAGAILVQTQSLTLDPGQNQTLTITWTTSTVARGTYQILASAVLSVDMDLSNNQRPAGSVVVQVHDVSLGDAFVSQTTINQGDPVTISVIVENSGDFTETVTVTVTVEGQTALPSQSASIPPGQVRTLNFTWTTTTNVAAGKYGYEATLQTIAGDSEADNVILAPDAVEVALPPAAAPPIDYNLLAILLIVVGLLAVVLVIRLRGRRSKTSPRS